MVGPGCKSHNITLDQHEPRNLHKPEVTSGTTSCLIGSPNLILGDISRMVGPTAKGHNIIFDWHDPKKLRQPEVTSRAPSGLYGSPNLYLFGGVSSQVKNRHISETVGDTNFSLKFWPF